mgnify:FL=1|jgi:hypothetical protein
MKKFLEVAMNKGNNRYENAISRRRKMIFDTDVNYAKGFELDYYRIMESNAYKRLRNKTQLFFSPVNDHVCTRSEHVLYVSSIASTIANRLGLNETLCKAIALGHDIGHAPFGHEGESILSKIDLKYCNRPFWHEKNGVVLADYFELVVGSKGLSQQLNLTYAVRDGIISHCGEVDDNGLKPRNEFINLERDYIRPNQYDPYTWEACVVKLSDKISYIMRDTEDALRLNVLTREEIERDLLYSLKLKFNEYNRDVIVGGLINDCVQNSNPEDGIRFSGEWAERLDAIKAFNTSRICFSERVKISKPYFSLILNTLFDLYYGLNDDGVLKIARPAREYGHVVLDFVKWLKIYCFNFKTDLEEINSYDDGNVYDFKKFIDLQSSESYVFAIIEYISGMTDRKAISEYERMITF